MSSRVRKHIHTLKVLSEGNRDINNAILRSSKPDLIHSLSECCKNILEGNVPLSSRCKSRLSRYKKDLRRVADKQTSHKRKKQTLQKGGFLPLLLAPLLSSVLAPALKGVISAVVK